MSIEVTIKQKGFFKKSITLDVILGKELKYGRFDGDHLEKGEFGKNEFIAYHPEHIGRGFSVDCVPYTKDGVYLRLPQPSTPQEIRDFYDTVQRIATYWKCSINVDGVKTSLKKFLSGYEDMVKFNEHVITVFCKEILEEGKGPFTFFSALWPLHVGKEEAEIFLQDVEKFYLWMHEKQNIDAEYADLLFFEEEGKVVGKYGLWSDTRHLFPMKPAVPIGCTFVETGEKIECSDWKMCIFTEPRKDPIAELPYEKFFQRIPKDKIRPHDCETYDILPLSEEEIAHIIAE